MLWHKVFFCAVLSLLFGQLPQVSSKDVNSGCKTNFTRVGDKCLISSIQTTNWYEADRNCRSLGAELLSVQTPTQLEEINQWLSNLGQSYMHNFWTSGNSLGGKNGTYFWQSTGKEATYLPWAGGQPQPTITNCLMLVSSDIFMAYYRLWVFSCEASIAYICEHQPQNSTISTTTRICLNPASFEVVQVIN
ncbi:C-type lectin 37Da-like [Drosophila nasuta]|uniref:C-type lectin 37Da-like n=1 Tax=Drosophila nasuta TaxID=42062 RepID=UPI00295F1FC7|nr:C-type lectin 37Da-like [Drosophila nasuta]